MKLYYSVSLKLYFCCLAQVGDFETSVLAEVESKYEIPLCTDEFSNQALTQFGTVARGQFNWGGCLDGDINSRYAFAIMQCADLSANKIVEEDISMGRFYSNIEHQIELYAGTSGVW